MQNNKNPITVTELLKELKENGFKKINDEYIDKVEFFPECIVQCVVQCVVCRLNVLFPSKLICMYPKLKKY